MLCHSLKVTAVDEPWLFVLIAANTCTGLIVYTVRSEVCVTVLWGVASSQNLTFQLQYISLLGTTYFDTSGNVAYKKKRFVLHIIVITKVEDAKDSLNKMYDERQ